MLSILLLFVVLWSYRHIGVLHYKISHARSDYEKTDVRFDEPPNLLKYLMWVSFWRYVKTGYPRRTPEGVYCFLWLKQWKDVKYLLRDYKEVYLWPIKILNNIYSDAKFGIYGDFGIDAARIIKSIRGG